MGVEIERKFLLVDEFEDDSWKRLSKRSSLIEQGYLSLDPERIVRIRVEEGQRDDFPCSAKLTVKGKTQGISRKEFEYSIPVEDANEMLKLCLGSIIYKTRFQVMVPLSGLSGLVWEIDVFDGDNVGLIVAEIELPNENFYLELPSWIRKEVSNDPRYFNSNLVTHPYKNWGGPGR